MRALLKSGPFWFIAVAVLVLLSGVVASNVFWSWLHPSAPTKVANSETLRNVGLLIGGLLAFVFAAWRAWVAGQQAHAAQRQAETADRGLLNDRYQKATEMLGSSVLAVRLGGINALQSLAEGHPEEYHVPVMKQLCSFVRHPPEVEGQPTVASVDIDLGSAYPASNAQDFSAAGTAQVEVVREDIQEAMDSIASCHTRNMQIETSNNYWLNLNGADLRGVGLIAKDLSGAPPGDIKGEPSFHYPNYAIIGWWYTNLKEANLRYAHLHHANLTNVDLSSASGLTQSALDDAYADPKMPPRLNYAFDFETGNPLVWNGPIEP